MTLGVVTAEQRIRGREVCTRPLVFRMTLWMLGGIRRGSGFIGRNFNRRELHYVQQLHPQVRSALCVIEKLCDSLLYLSGTNGAGPEGSSKQRVLTLQIRETDRRSFAC